LFDFIGLGFSREGKEIIRPTVPEVQITVNGKVIDLPVTPLRSTNENGIVGYDLYEVAYVVPLGTKRRSKVSASSDNPKVKVAITQQKAPTGTATVQFDYNGIIKTYKINIVHNK